MWNTHAHTYEMSFEEFKTLHAERWIQVGDSCLLYCLVLASITTTQQREIDPQDECLWLL